METVAITSGRKAQLEAYARRRGKDPAAALDDVLADYLECEEEEYREAIEGIREGYEDLQAGRIQSADEVIEELRAKHGLPR